MNKQGRARKNAKAGKSPSAAKASGNIRIIAGKHRGRKLPVLMADGLRPTTDRVKETLFNWLIPYIQDSRCLDCFAGAGSLGFEAVSRGAKEVTMFELNKAAAKQLKANAQLLKIDNAEICQGDTLALLGQTPTPHDIVFVDPPFRQGLTEKTLSILLKGWLADKAIVYVETESERPLTDVPNNWQLLKEKVAGQVAYRLYQVG